MISKVGSIASVNSDGSLNNFSVVKISAIKKPFIFHPHLQKTQLDEAISDIGGDSTDGKFDFVSFCSVATKFMIEEDVEQMREELKEAFR